ncbi:MAG TPA: hypothetical protein VGG26_09100 [Terracidiphilus sp.]|jgi:hypothetical protein
MAQLPFSQAALGIPARLLAAFLVLGLGGSWTQAQSAAPSSSAGATAAPATSGSPATESDDAWLKKTGSLYYSSAKSGLGGFDCAVHPDWRTLFGSAGGSTNSPAVADGDARLLLLETVKINLHAHMQGGSTLDWNRDPHSGEPLDDKASALLAKMRQTTEQTLEGFLQFWTPFVDGSIVPDSAAGLAITHTGTLNTIHAEQGDTALTETFSSDLHLEHFDVKMNGISIKFQPDYQPTEQGLLVKSFEAHVQPAGVPPDQAQEMHVEIEYQTLDGFPIPSRLTMEVANTGNFSFVLDGCTVSRLQKPEPANVVRPALQ